MLKILEIFFFAPRYEQKIIHEGFVEFVAGLDKRVQVFLVLEATGLGGSRVCPILQSHRYPRSVDTRVLTHHRSRRLQVHNDMSWIRGYILTIDLIFDHL